MFWMAFAGLFMACEGEPDKNSYEYKVDQFVKQATIAYTDTSQTLDYNELTSFGGSLNGAHVNDIKLTQSNGEKLTLGDIQMPIVLETFASWCPPCVSSLPALNHLAEVYEGKVQFIIITEESKNAFKSDRFNISEKIKLVHANDDFTPSNITYLQAGNFKSALPFPTMYFIDEKKTITYVKTGAPRVGNFGGGNSYTKEDVNRLNIEMITKELEAFTFQ